MTSPTTHTHVSAYCQAELATRFNLARKVRRQSTSSALREAMDLYIEFVAHNDEGPAVTPSLARKATGAGPDET